MAGSSSFPRVCHRLFLCCVWTSSWLRPLSQAGAVATCNIDAQVEGPCRPEVANALMQVRRDTERFAVPAVREEAEKPGSSKTDADVMDLAVKQTPVEDPKEAGNHNDKTKQSDDADNANSGVVVKNEPGSSNSQEGSKANNSNNYNDNDSYNDDYDNDYDNDNDQGEQANIANTTKDRSDYDNDDDGAHNANDETTKGNGTDIATTKDNGEVAGSAAKKDVEARASAAKTSIQDILAKQKKYAHQEAMAKKRQTDRMAAEKAAKEKKQAAQKAEEELADLHRQEEEEAAKMAKQKQAAEKAAVDNIGKYRAVLEKATQERMEADKVAAEKGEAEKVALQNFAAVEAIAAKHAIMNPEAEGAPVEDAPDEDHKELFVAFHKSAEATKRKAAKKSSKSA